VRAGDDRGNVKIPGSFGESIFRGNGLHALEEFKLSACPSARMVIHKATPGKRRGPDIVP